MNPDSRPVTVETSIIVVMTCHNRRSMSVRAVTQLREQSTSSRRIDFIAVDDGSSDGTGQALRELDVDVIDGDGKLFWAGGMGKAHTAATLRDPDLILWVNDDLDFASDAIDSLVSEYRKTTGCNILIGAVASTSTGAISYGGRNQNPQNPLSFKLAGRESLGQTVDTFNGNFVGVPRAVYREVDFPQGYKHAYADLVFGITARNKGFAAQVLPEIVGVNDRNPQTGKMFSRDVKLWSRIQFALSPFGLPLRQQWRFARLMAGRSAPIWFIRSYIRIFVPSERTAVQE